MLGFPYKALHRHRLISRYTAGEGMDLHASDYRHTKSRNRQVLMLIYQTAPIELRVLFLNERSDRSTSHGSNRRRDE